MDYNNYYKGLKHKLLGLVKTEEITETIKDYTKQFFSNKEEKIVSCIAKDKKKGEFLYDISVLSFEPTNSIKHSNKKIFINSEFNNYRAYLLLESELGGNGGTSPYGVMKNVVEDFCKLLIGRSKNKIMIMAMSQYKNENEFVKNRLRLLSEIYEKSDCDSDIFVIAIEGIHPESGKQIELNTQRMHHEIFTKKCRGDT